MTKKQITNLPASIRARLYDHAKNNSLDFDSVVLRFMQERFLYRLSISPYKSHFILKGGLLLLLSKGGIGRPTLDIDLLGYNISGDAEKIGSFIREIVSLENPDGIVFDEAMVQLETIKEAALYQGLRVKIPTRLDTIQRTMQIDIGFGDIITPEPIEKEYPTVLDYSAALIMTYPMETVIAEKWQAIVSLGIVSSRMKDYYDVWFLLQQSLIDNVLLKQALTRTFEHRHTLLQDSSFIFEAAFKQNSDKQKQWKAFLRKTSIDCPIEFSVIVEAIEANFKKRGIL